MPAGDAAAASRLQQELQKKGPFDSLQQEAFLNLWRTFDQMQSELEDLLAKQGLSAERYNVLRILRGHGKAGLPSREIAGQMVTRMPDVTRLIDRLERDGLALRTRSSDDRRVVLVSITAVGRRVLRKLDKPVLDKHRQQMRPLKQAELKKLNSLLVALRGTGDQA